MTDPVSFALVLALGLLLLAYALVLIVRWPAQSVLVMVPIVVWPSQLTLADLPVGQLLVAVVLLGVLFSRRNSLGDIRQLLLAVTSLTVLLLVSHYLHEPTLVRSSSEARNSMLTLVLNLWLVVAYSVAKPRRVLTMKWLAGSLSLAAAYLAVTGDFSGGRLMTEDVNSNAAGHAAALAILLTVGIWRAPASPWWGLCAVPPLYVLYVTQSRGALTVLAVGLAAIAVLTFSGVRRLAVALIGGVFLILLWGPLSTLISEKVLSARDATFVENDTRILMLRLSWESITVDPFGIGYAKFLDLSRPHVGVGLNTHNDWVRIAVEVGLLSVALLAFVVASRVFETFKNDQCTIALKAVVLAGCVSWMFANVTTDLRLSLPVWACAGLLWVVPPRQRTGSPVYHDETVQSAGRS